MTTTLNKRFIFNLIRRPPAPGDEADLFYTQCSLMPLSLSEKPRFGSGHETILNAANIDVCLLFYGVLQYTMYNNYICS